MSKTTIAIAGASGKAGSSIALKLAQGDFRLLLISRDKNNVDELLRNIQRSSPKAEVEAIDCVKDGCWEADIIVLAVPAEAEKVVAENIREVATQKIIVRLAREADNSFNSKLQVGLQQSLPHSKIVEVIVNTSVNETFISGDDDEAVQTILNIALNSGCKIVSPASA